MTAKLHIDLTQGVLDVEGDADFVREIYQDFKDRIAVGSPLQTDATNKTVVAKRVHSNPKSKRRSQSRTKSSVDRDASGVNADSPNMDKSLDTVGLVDYFGKFEPKNHPEKILIFLKFLTEELGIESPNTDQVYTCYESIDERVPKAFAQAFRDTSGRKFGFIDFNSPTDIKVTTLGSNHFKFDLKKK